MKAFLGNITPFWMVYQIIQLDKKAWVYLLEITLSFPQNPLDDKVRIKIEFKWIEL